MSFIITMTVILILCVFLQVLNILNDLLKELSSCVEGLDWSTKNTELNFNCFQHLSNREPVLISDIPPQSHLWTKA